LSALPIEPSLYQSLHQKETVMKTTKPSTAANPTTAASSAVTASIGATDGAKTTPPESSEALTGQPAQIHDLSAYVVLCVPPEMRLLLGEEIYQQRVLDLEEMGALITVRQTDKVLFITAPIRVAVPGAGGLYSMARNGITVHDAQAPKDEKNKKAIGKAKVAKAAKTRVRKP
jgi:hypothetical protein